MHKRLYKPLFATLTAAARAACVEQKPIKGSAPLTTTDEAQVNVVVYEHSALGQENVVSWLERHLQQDRQIEYTNPVDRAAAEFVQLALHMGRFDDDYVDAYHGPTTWKTSAATMTANASELAQGIARLQQDLDLLATAGNSSIRLRQLQKLTRALALRFKVVQGAAVSFNEELTEIYDEQIPTYDLAAYDRILAEIDALIPGDESLSERVYAFRSSLRIPEDKLQVVFDKAIDECRRRTAQYFDLPDGESFRMEFVKDKPWGGYNYYQGGYESLIQINTDFPIFIDRAVDLGCHEGYPGHHVWNLFIESELVGRRGWCEHTVNPLFSPFAPIAEGSANYGIELAFPGEEKINFEREVLFPLAGIDPSFAERLQALNQLTNRLSHARNEIARRYLDGDLTDKQAVALLQKYQLVNAERAKQSLSFIEKYRAYVINYNIGKDRAESWIASVGSDENARWAAFKDILVRPMTPGDIVEGLEP